MKYLVCNIKYTLPIEDKVVTRGIQNLLQLFMTETEIYQSTSDLPACFLL